MSNLLFFITSGIGLENKLANPAPSWLADKSWNEICRLDEVKGLESFRDHFVQNIDFWKEYYDSKEPHTYNLIKPWNDLDMFNKLIILRCIRPDKVGRLI